MASIRDTGKGKRRMIDVMAEAAETIETASSPSPPPTTPPPDNPVEDPARWWDARELRNEQEYGELLDSVIL